MPIETIIKQREKPAEEPLKFPLLVESRSRIGLVILFTEPMKGTVVGINTESEKYFGYQVGQFQDNWREVTNLSDPSSYWKKFEGELILKNI